MPGFEALGVNEAGDSTELGFGDADIGERRGT